MKFCLVASWKYRQLTLGQYIACLRGFLADLMQVDAMFAEIYDSGKKPNDETKIESDLSNLPALAMAKAYDRKSKESYKPVNPDGTLMPDTVSDLGYSLTFFNRKKLGKGLITISTRAGSPSPYLNSAVGIQFQDDQHPEGYDYAFWLRMMEITVRHWQPQFGRVFDHAFYDKTIQKGDDAIISWINYFSDPAIREIKDDSIVINPFGQGAVIILSEMPVSAENPEDVSKAIYVRDVLREKGLLTYRRPI